MENIIKTLFKEEREYYPGKSFDIEEFILNFLENNFKHGCIFIGSINSTIWDYLGCVNNLNIVINSGVSFWKKIGYKARVVTYFSKIEKIEINKAQDDSDTSDSDSDSDSDTIDLDLPSNLKILKERLKTFYKID